MPGINSGLFRSFILCARFDYEIGPERRRLLESSRDRVAQVKLNFFIYFIYLFIYLPITPRNVSRVAQSVQRLTTGWTVRGSNPGGGEIFRTCPDRPWGPSSLLYNGYWFFLGVKSGRVLTLTPHSPSSAVVKKE